MQRSWNHSDINTVIKYIQDELKGSSLCFGNRYMLQKLHSSGLTADKETVRLILKSLDLVGVDKRKRRKLTPRRYHSFGPNHTCHIDGYDELKPFGIAIHEATDGLSQRIIWLKLSSSNNPKVIANYYLCCIKQLNLIPHVVRGDHGTENVIVCEIQRFLRRNHTDSQSKDKSFIYGHSTTNQRIESPLTDCKFPLDIHDVNLTMDYCETPSLFGCSA